MLCSCFKRLIHCFKTLLCIRINIPGLQWNKQAIEYFPVNEANLIALDLLDDETVLASEQARKEDVILPAKFSILVYCDNSAM